MSTWNSAQKPYHHRICFVRQRGLCPESDPVDERLPCTEQASQGATEEGEQAAVRENAGENALDRNSHEFSRTARLPCHSVKQIAK